MSVVTPPSPPLLASPVPSEPARKTPTPPAADSTALKVEAAVAKSTDASAASSSTACEPMLTTLVISTSLREGSRSKKLALKIQERMKRQLAFCDFLDMSQYPNLPQCDGKKCYTDENVKKLSKQIEKATSVILCFPVYNNSINAVGKNLIEVTGKAWENKVVGLVATAGSARSFMAPLGVAANLMSGSSCLIVPKYVFADTNDFPEKADEPSVELNKRLEKLITTTTGLHKHYKALQTA